MLQLQGRGCFLPHCSTGKLEVRHIMRHSSPRFAQPSLSSQASLWPSCNRVLHSSTGSCNRPTSQLQAVAGRGLPTPAANPLQWLSQTTVIGRGSTAAPESADRVLLKYTTQRIKLCSDWNQLARVVAVYGRHFNAINICAALVHLAQLGHGPQQPHPGHSTDGGALDDYAAYEALLQQLLQMACQLVPQLQARQVANVLWASATLSAGYTGGHPRCMDLMLQLLPVSSALLPWSKAQELANSIWAVATARLPADDTWLLQFLNSAETALPQTTCQDLATMLWALAELGVAPDTEWLGAYAVRVRQLESNITHRDAAQILAAMAHLGINLAALDGELLSLLRGRLLDGSGGAAGMAGGATGVSKAASGVERRSSRHKAGGQWSVSISQGLWSMARMSAVPPTAWMQQVLSLIERRLPEFGPRELSTALWASVTLGQAVPSSLVRAVYACTLTQPEATTSATSTDYSSTSTSRQAEGVEQPAGAGPQLLSSFCPQSLAELIWAISNADQAHSARSGGVTRPLAPSAAWTQAFLDAVSSRLPHGFTEQPTAMVLVALARLRITPPPAWASAIISHVNTTLTDIRPQPLTNCMWALATLGFQVNAEGLAALERQLEATLQPAGSADTAAGAANQPQQQPEDGSAQGTGDGWGSQELSNTLWVLAKWKHRPSDSVLQLLLGRLRALCVSRSAEIRPQELANALWALGQLGVQPSHSWLADFWASCARRMGMFNSKDISQLVHALAKLGRRPPTLGRQGAGLSKVPALPSAWGQGNLLPPGESLLSPEEQETATAAAAALEVQQAASIAANVVTSGPPPGTGRKRPTAAPLAMPSEATGTPLQASDVVLNGGVASTASQRIDWTSVLLPEAASTFGRCNGQDLANLSWGLAQLQVRPGQAWCERMAKELMTRGSSFKGNHLATSVWALGSMGYQPAPQSLLPLEGALFRRMPSLAPRELAACSWGFASMGYRPDQEWLEAFAMQCRIMAPEFTQQDWSVVVYSLSGIVDSDKTAGVYLEDLFLSPQLAACLDQFGPSGVAILLYAASVLGSKSPRLIGPLLAAATRHMPHFNGRELAALITTCARTGVAPDRDLFAAWANEVAERMRNDLSDLPANATAAGSLHSATARPRAQGFGVPSHAPIPSRISSLLPEELYSQGVQSAPARLSKAEEAAIGYLVAPDVDPDTDPESVPSSQAAQEPMTSTAELDTTRGGAADNSTSNKGVSEAGSLTPSMLAVSGWALAKLGMRPKSDWLQLYHTLLTHHARCGALKPKETHMVTLALAGWERQVPYELVRALRLLVVQHKPMYTKSERYSINTALKTLRKYSTAPPHLQLPKASKLQA